MIQTTKNYTGVAEFKSRLKPTEMLWQDLNDAVHVWKPSNVAESMSKTLKCLIAVGVVELENRILYLFLHKIHILLMNWII